jgi:hypothetical protein
LPKIEALLTIVNDVVPTTASESLETEFERIRDKLSGITTTSKNTDQQALEALGQILIDLKKRGWDLRITNGRLEGRPPRESSSTQREDRKAELSGRRHEQLREPATRGFIQDLEHGQVTITGRRSIFDLMRDGRELAKTVELGSNLQDGQDPLGGLQPYLQYVTKEQRCQHTGLRLRDIWRYFRHTWSNPYESIPGRSMLVLLRDAGAPYHPVMGIAALSSATAQLDARDRFLGWESATFLERCATEPPTRIANWIQDTLSVALDEIYITDFLSEGLLSPQELTTPSDHVVSVLRHEADNARKQYQALESPEERTEPNHNLGLDPDEYWTTQAQSLLFRSKRAAALAAVLLVTQALSDGLGKTPFTGDFQTWASVPARRDAFLKLIRIARSKTIGTAIADLTVCGAVPPYNELLSGKLMAMLAASPEMVNEYEHRYKNTASIIASSMAGRSICRPAKLSVISTTSLYGIRPCQYDRVSVPAEILGGISGTRIGYKFLEHRTLGYGTFQFSRRTKNALGQTLAMSAATRVNNRFGEGSSPKFRALREGLEFLGLDAEGLLQHGRAKSLYVSSLIADPAGSLLGLDKEPTYLFNTALNTKGTSAICNWWKRRWVLPRLARTNTKSRIAQHTLIRPISHGAKVQLPDPDLDQPGLFTD